MRLVVDTNVLVAAFRSNAGASSRLLRYANEGSVKLLCSTALFLEYEAVLGRPSIRQATGHSLDDVRGVMSAIAAIAEPVDVPLKARPVLRDAEDEMVLEVALNGGADCIVTHNARDFEASRALGIEVGTPAEIVRSLRK